MRKIIAVILAMLVWSVASVVAADKTFTLVIDAGHGGKDPGAKGNFSYEKNINLKVALAFGAYVERNCPDVKVIYTRKTDVFIALSERANIANRNKADLFISVHTNSLPAGKISRGFETYTLGMHRAADNLDVAKRENSVILIESDYKQRYAGFDPNSAESYIMFEMMQDKNMSNSVALAKLIQDETCSLAGRQNKGVHQAGFLVLRETSMPSCLIELGFISTPDEEQFLNTAEGQDLLARGIFNAFKKYKDKRRGKMMNTVTTGKQNSAGKKDELKREQQKLKEAEAEAEHAKKLQKEAEAAAEKAKKKRQQAEAEAEKSRKKRQQAEAEAEEAAEKRRLAEAGVEKEKLERQQEAEEAAAEKARKKRQQETEKARRQDAKERQRLEETRRQEEQQGVADPVLSKKNAPTMLQADVPVFMVQIMALNSQQPPEKKLLEGLQDLGSFNEGNMTKYTVGASNDYYEIVQLKKALADRFPEAFIIAFKEGKKMDTAKAVEEFKRNKNR